MIAPYFALADFRRQQHISLGMLVINQGHAILHATTARGGKVGKNWTRCSRVCVGICSVGKRSRHVLPPISEYIGHHSIFQLLLNFNGLLDHLSIEGHT
jgi:hypothetical protein